MSTQEEESKESTQQSTRRREKKSDGKEEDKEPTAAPPRKKVCISRPPVNAVIDQLVLRNVQILFELLMQLPLPSVFSFMNSCRQAYEIIKQNEEFWGKVWKTYPFWHNKSNTNTNVGLSHFTGTKSLLSRDRKWIRNKEKVVWSELSSYPFEVYDICVNEGRLAASAKDFSLTIYNLKTGRTHGISCRPEPYLLVRLRGNLLVYAPRMKIDSSSRDGAITVMDLNTRVNIFSVQCRISKELELIGNILVGVQGFEATAYDIRAREIVKTFKLNDAHQTHMQFDGQKILMCSKKPTELFDFGTAQDMLKDTKIGRHDKAYFNNNWIVGGRDGSLFRYDISMTKRSEIIQDKKTHRIGDFKMIGNQIVASLHKKAICLYNVNTASMEREMILSDPTYSNVNQLEFDDNAIYFSSNKSIYMNSF